MNQYPIFRNFLSLEVLITTLGIATLGIARAAYTEMIPISDER